ncbi:hypothetical protein QK292_08170 [Arthrobacter sp. AL08]|uniref:hypothetical protein n=1 Tax=unclassified Arthrobacter TaxID=235627 RepID=UPI00249C433C|nr:MULTISPECIES: hypothetical protein [unclassified Arthrobacter]MDI3241541.1 hypothetical protein [Arthrobacter sp. AL05]MDI3277551.1 hypothetical protein [Arthrobacter sp. AL08]
MNLRQKLGTAVIGVSIPAIVIFGSSLLQGPTANQAPNAAEWLSAISTFWGAIAGAIGAIGTAGALWLGAITFRRQVNDQHRAQAAAVTLHVALEGGLDNSHVVQVASSNNLPIYNMELVCLDSEGGQLDRFVKHVVTREFSQYLDDALPLHEAFVTFTDSSGVRWQRWSKGKLIELGREPADFDIVETPAASYEERNKKLQERMVRRQATHDG